MIAVHAFLVFWHWFAATHSCQVFVPDSAGNGDHVVYGGNCTDAFNYARAIHGVVAWSGTSQGLSQF